MGKKATLLLMQLWLEILTYIVAGFTIAAWFARITPPQNSWFITFLGMGMIFLLIADFLLFAWWLYKRRYLAILPAAVMLLNIGFITATIQFDFRGDQTDRTDLKVATYNIHGYGRKDLKGMMENLARYLENEKVDIACFQEFWTNDKCSADTIKVVFAPTMPYSVTIPQGDHVEIAIFSKYPITNSSLMTFAETANSVVWADINVKGHDIRLFNAHFQTTNINQSKSELSELKSKGITDREGKKAFDIIMDRLRFNAYKRTEQVEAVRTVMDTTTKPIIFCGDFNETPSSYSYARIKEGIIDGFKSGGKGYAYTYKELLHLLRLDYIFHAPELEGIKYYSPSLSWSDHNPVLMELAFRN